jgi:hypothetical protein
MRKLMSEYSWKDAMHNIVQAINEGIRNETARLQPDEKIKVEVIDKEDHAVVNVTRIKKEKDDD